MFLGWCNGVRRIYHNGRGFFEKRRVLIHPTSDILENFPEIRWEGDDWKGFIMVAKYERV